MENETYNWKTSSFSAGGQCIQQSKTNKHVFIRDSKHPHGYILMFTHAEFEAYKQGIIAGEF